MGSGWEDTWKTDSLWKPRFYDGLESNIMFVQEQPISENPAFKIVSNGSRSGISSAFRARSSSRRRSPAASTATISGWGGGGGATGVQRSCWGAALWLGCNAETVAMLCKALGQGQSDMPRQMKHSAAPTFTCCNACRTARALHIACMQLALLPHNWTTH